MPETLHFVQRFQKNGRRFVGRQPELCASADHALSRGKRAAEDAAGVVVYSLVCEPDFGEIEPAVIIATYGETPCDVN
jgi:hypothetical protein